MTQDLLPELLSYRSDIAAFAYSICGDYHLSDDVAQETILVVMRKYQEQDELRHPKAWVREIARREVRYQLRKRRRGGREHCVADLEQVLDQAFEEASETSDNSQEQAALGACLQDLGERVRTMLVQRLVDQREYDEIANDLSCKPDAVRQTVSRTRRKLMGCVERRMRLGVLADG